MYIITLTVYAAVVQQGKKINTLKICLIEKADDQRSHEYVVWELHYKVYRAIKDA